MNTQVIVTTSVTFVIGIYCLTISRSKFKRISSRTGAEAAVLIARLLGICCICVGIINFYAEWRIGHILENVPQQIPEMSIVGQWNAEDIASATIVTTFGRIEVSTEKSIQSLAAALNSLGKIYPDHPNYRKQVSLEVSTNNGKTWRYNLQYDSKRLGSVDVWFEKDGFNVGTYSSYELGSVIDAIIISALPTPSPSAASSAVTYSAR